jgi:hypothetical protein
VDGEVKSNDPRARDALWIKFGSEPVNKNQEFRAADGNQFAQHLDADGALVGIEISPRMETQQGSI